MRRSSAHSAVSSICSAQPAFGDGDCSLIRNFFRSGSRRESSSRVGKRCGTSCRRREACCFKKGPNQARSGLCCRKSERDCRDFSPKPGCANEDRVDRPFGLWRGAGVSAVGHRIYHEEKLNDCWRDRSKRVLGMHAPSALPDAMNRRWSRDFVRMRSAMSLLLHLLRSGGL